MQQIRFFRERVSMNRERNSSKVWTETSFTRVPKREITKKCLLRTFSILLPVIFIKESRPVIIIEKKLGVSKLIILISSVCLAANCGLLNSTFTHFCFHLSADSGVRLKSAVEKLLEMVSVMTRQVNILWDC